MRAFQVYDSGTCDWVREHSLCVYEASEKMPSSKRKQSLHWHSLFSMSMLLLPTALFLPIDMLFRCDEEETDGVWEEVAVSYWDSLSSAT